MPDRRPRDVFDHGNDPDPRMSLANERTLLAWIRTALSLTAGAIAVHAPALDFPEWVRILLSALLLALAAIAVFQGWTRWQRTELAMRTGAPMPGFAGGLTFAAGIGLLVLGALVAVLFKH